MTDEQLKSALAEEDQWIEKVEDIELALRGLAASATAENLEGALAPFGFHRNPRLDESPFSWSIKMAFMAQAGKLDGDAYCSTWPDMNTVWFWIEDAIRKCGQMTEAALARKELMTAACAWEAEEMRPGRKCDRCQKPLGVGNTTCFYNARMLVCRDCGESYALRIYLQKRERDKSMAQAGIAADLRLEHTADQTS